VSAEFVAAMEDVLEVYAEPYDPRRPKVNFDEASKQLIQETRVPLPARPGQPQRYDDEYERNGTRNLFLFVEPQAGWRHVHVTEHRTAQDFAYAMQWLVDEAYPEADVIRIILDNLNTHKLASLYEAFTPAEARRIARKLEWHYTPKHGSWLNMAEIELSVLQQQCLGRRLPHADTLTREIAAWEHQRNVEKATIDWRFSVTDARQKLEGLYPSLPS
jgi:DDE superfamily endonuclease